MLLRLPQVTAMTGLPRSTIYLRVKEKTFPLPINLGPRSVAWVKEEVEGWVRDRIRQSRSHKK